MHVLFWVLFGLINTLLFLHEDKGIAHGHKLHAFLFGVTTALSGGVLASVFLNSKEANLALLIILAFEAVLLFGLLVKNSLVRTV
jgi:hypothetical protein